MRFAIAALLLAPAVMRAQSLELGAASLDAKHYLMPRLGGPSVQLVTGSANARLRWQLGIERATGGQDRIGVPCVGLAYPGEDCSPTAMHDDASLTTVGIGPRVALLRRARIALDGMAMVRAGRVRAESVAPARGSEFVAGEQVIGAEAGACAAWRPFTRVPIAATVALSVGRLAPVSLDHVADGYAPFGDVMPYARMQVGLSWR